MNTLTTKQAQRLDRYAIEIFGIPSIVLMENAGRLVAESVKRRWKRKKDRVVVICGPGNNAGDGFVTARHLYLSGIPCRVYCLSDPRKFKEDSRINFSLLKKSQCPVALIRKVDAKVLRQWRQAALIVDAIFGIGLNREVASPFKEAIEAINICRGRVFAVDIPSGLNATTGDIFGSCIKADETITFVTVKRGFCLSQGKERAGQIKVVDIGIPETVIRKVLR